MPDYAPESAFVQIRHGKRCYSLRMKAKKKKLPPGIRCTAKQFLHMGLELTKSEITDYLLRNAFSTKRTEASNKTHKSSKSALSDVIKTSTLDKTLKLLKGSNESLDKVQSNLKKMKEIADSITSSSDTKEREEAYAKLRSLASGMDDILEEITFGDNVIFDGSQMDLTSAGQYNRMVMKNLMTTSEEVGLASQETGADAKITYDDFCKWNNTLLGVKGLDISGATGCKITAGSKELEDGEYRLKVTYAGPKSTVAVIGNNGDVISEKTNVDLSGSGVTSVELDCGVKVSFDKTQIQGSFTDKYDYEKKGPAVLYANLEYSRVDTFDLAGSQKATDRGVKTIYTQKAATDAAGGKFGIGGVGLGTLDDDEEGLGSGTYKVEVYKINGDVSAIMYDSRGKVVGGVSDVILNENGTTSLDFGNGVAMTVTDKNFSGNTTLVSTFEYTEQVKTYDDFDFEEYSKSITDAMKVVTEQQDTLTSAYALSNTVNQALNGTLSSKVHSTSSLLINNLLGGSSKSAMSLLYGTSARNTGLGWSSSLITNNLSRALGLSTDSGTSLSSLLSGKVDRLDPVELPTHLSVTV
jgi:hypothetical protein